MDITSPSISHARTSILRSDLPRSADAVYSPPGAFSRKAHFGSHEAYLKEYERAIDAFNQAMKELDASDSDFDYNNVVGFQASDFNRTWTPNGSDFATSGTDHAWGTNAFLFGGPVNGSQIFGQIPQLRIGGADDVPAGSRGRWIPTTAVEQYSAVLAKWLGVPAVDIETIFPNLSRFPDPFDASASGPNLDLIDFLA